MVGYVFIEIRKQSKWARITSPGLLEVGVVSWKFRKYKFQNWFSKESGKVDCARVMSQVWFFGRREKWNYDLAIRSTTHGLHLQTHTYANLESI